MVRKTHQAKNNDAISNRYLRFQLTALMATAVDFLVTVLLKENSSLIYTWAVAGGACAGAITAFTINRYWVFQSLNENPLTQWFRYVLVAFGSIILNTAGTYLVTESAQIPYLVSKGITSLIIGFTYSYYFSKRFVFYA